jgi:hypothetical protein
MCRRLQRWNVAVVKRSAWLTTADTVTDNDLVSPPKLMIQYVSASRQVQREYRDRGAQRRFSDESSLAWSS